MPGSYRFAEPVRSILKYCESLFELADHDVGDAEMVKIGLGK